MGKFRVVFKSPQLFSWASELNSVFKFKLLRSRRIIFVNNLKKNLGVKNAMIFNQKKTTTFHGNCLLVYVLNLSLDTDISHVIGHFGTTVACNPP